MLHRWVTFAARVMAGLGGLVLLALILMICVSVAGRGLADLAFSGALGGLGDWLSTAGVGPILGDFELVEAGVAFAIFAFLPLTQLSGAHARVDVFTTGMGPRTNRWLAGFWSVVMAAIILLITWRLYAGLQDKLRYGETTFLIQFPLWGAYAASFAAAVVASITAVYCAVMHLAGRPVDE
ncbi:MAG: TRAP transporter small permease subunit [Pseudomonadota bacterium]